MTHISAKNSKRKSPYKPPIDLSFGYHNIEGIHSPQFGCKLPFIHTKLIHDIEILSETWGACTHEKNVAGYKIIEQIAPHKKSNIRKGRASGGIIVYCKEHLHKHIKKTKLTPHYLWLTIDKTIFYNLKTAVKVCVAYNPPENSKYCNKEMYEDISSDLLKISNSKHPILLIGDLNSRTGNLPDFEDTSEKHMEYTVGRKIFPTLDRKSVV